MTPQQLKDIELRYGEPVPVLRSVVSKHDHRSPEKLKKNPCMIGSDRMTVHGYADVYAQYLPKHPKVIIELGVLQGTGLAMWCELYPDARVIGLDIDPDIFEKNKPNLIKRGAFLHNQPEIYYFDELEESAHEKIKNILHGDQIDVMIDDALHYDAAIIKASFDFVKCMAPGSVYFVEDNKTVWRELSLKWPGLFVLAYDEITVIRGF